MTDDDSNVIEGEFGDAADEGVVGDAEVTEEEDVPSIFDTMPDVYEGPIPLSEEIFQPSALVLDMADVGFEEFARLTGHLYRLKHGIQFWAGDLYNLGQDKWGDEVWQVFDHFNETFKPGTIDSWGRVCERIPKEDRVDALDYTHHKYAADLKNITSIRAALRKAAEGRWTTDEMLEYVKKKLHPEEEEKSEDPKERGRTNSISWTFGFNLAPADEAIGDEMAEAISRAMHEIIGQYSVEVRSVLEPRKEYNESAPAA